ncbi:5-formyltetrahydrofolate cyclo-ligase [Microbacterium mitrae]|uniref:5-formyltetrahydrofolate cyclo-ligase n=1 Tax=Microbacterium mitrae TaxID=664640 RepID=A0A5C8HPK1_9MICO|nr:5-formyltetrahydrofolate cyclo-ligase [Microbacterium mitrae]TXK04475.1 5-formyltetrahydrofolate cyclo-ligase [Microbacterium mitrae]
MPEDIEHVKQALRADLRQRRHMLSPIQQEHAEESLTEQLWNLVDATGATSISCYLSTTLEPGTRTFVNQAIERGLRVLLPSTRADGLLDWVVATVDGDETDGPLGVPEPVGELLGPIAVDEVDLLLIPAAAVDESGMRLGWGRGYFDKTIGSMQKCPPVYAVIFDSELLDEVPAEPHDQPVSGVVTPTRIVTFAAH